MDRNSTVVDNSVPVQFLEPGAFVQCLPPTVTKNQIRIGVRQPREERSSVVRSNHVTKGLADAERFFFAAE